MAESGFVYCQEQFYLIDHKRSILDVSLDKMFLSLLMNLPNITIDSSAIRNHRIFSVTSCSFEISWSVNSTLNHTFQVEVFKDKDIFKSMATTEMRVDVSDLEAGIMYLVKISYETCGKTIISHQSAKTSKYPI